MRLGKALPRLTVVVLVAAAVFFVFAGSAYANDVYVNCWVGDDTLGDGSVISPYETIGYALSQVETGDTIYLSGGLFSASEELPSDLSVIGAGMGATYVTPASDAPMFEIGESWNVYIEDITFTGGDTEGGSAFYIYGSDTVTLEQCEFEYCTASNGGAVYIDSSEVEIENCDFHDNTARDTGGALYCDGAYDVELLSTDFEDCTADDDGGAVWAGLFDDAAVFYVDGCDFYDNSAEDGGAIDFDGDYYNSTVEIHYSDFDYNSADYDSGAVDLEGCYSPVVEGCDFYGNSAGNAMDDRGMAGALWIGYVSGGEIYDNYFENNFSQFEGGAVVLEYADSVNLYDNYFYSNYAVAEGGAVYLTECEGIYLEENEFEENISASDGGAIAGGRSNFNIDNGDFYGNSAYHGGAVSTWNSYCDIENSYFEDNEAEHNGGALYVDAYDYDEWIDLEDTWFYNNSAGDDGGGIYFQTEGSYTGMSIWDCWIEENSAGNDGGGICFVGYDDGDELHIDDSDFYGNEAEDSGGGLYASDVESDLCLEGNDWEANSAGNYGGAIYDTNSDGCGLDWSDFWDNTAGVSGGAVYAEYTNLYVDETWFWDNAALNEELVEGGGNGGAIASYSSDLYVDASEFYGNQAEHAGGAIWDWSPYAYGGVVNSIFDSNEAPSGAAMLTAGSTSIAFDTFWGNTGLDNTWGDEVVLSLLGGETDPSIVTNCIFDSNLVGLDMSGSSSPTYSFTSQSGLGNTDAWPGPLFVDPADDDFRLKSGSVCIDAGSDTYYAIDHDLDYGWRPEDGDGDLVPQYDMGAYEAEAPEPPYVYNGNYYTTEDTPYDSDGGLAYRAYDSNGDELTFSLVDPPAHGIATVLPDGSFIYVPAPNYNGSDSFTWRAFDGTWYSNTATANIYIQPWNDAPVANDDSGECSEDTSVTIDACANDTDVDIEASPTGVVDTMNPVVYEQPGHGSASIVGGQIRYVPDADFYGTDSFTYRAYDGQAYSNVASVDVTVTAVNDAPRPQDDETTVSEDGSVDINVLANDSDPEDDPIFIDAIADTSEASGTVEIIEGDQIRYTPNEDFDGEAWFTYTITDDDVVSDPATVTIDVTPVNDAPVAEHDYYECDEEGQIVVAAPGVLGNDSDVDGDELTAVLDSEPGNGDVVFNSDGSFTYTPDENVSGHFHLYYRAYDGEEYSDSVYVCLQVNGVNDAPVVNDDVLECDEDASANLNVLDNDTDADEDELTAELKSTPAHGSVEFNANGDATYTPDEDWYGSDSFTYRAYDGHAYSLIGVVSVEVTATNDLPVAADDTYEVEQGDVLVIEDPGVLENDSDVDGDTLTAELDSDVTQGVLTLDPDGSFTYTPDEDFTGEDTFTYLAWDGEQYSETAQVTITVTKRATDDDDTPPVTTSDATGLYYGSAKITLKATDEGSGVAKTYYSLDGATKVVGTVIEISTLGDHALSFWSVDWAGNVEEATYVEFTIESGGADFDQIAGANRYVTAAEASKDAFPDGTDCVLVATGEAWPDALGSAALAGVCDAPILLTQTDTLPSVVTGEIKRLDATKAYVIGGTSAVGDDVVTALKGLGLTVKRIGGSNRYQTARLLAEETAKMAGESFDDTCFVATGVGFPDSLAAGPLSAKMGWPLVLSDSDGLDDVTLTSLVDMGIKNVIVLGGEAALPAKVETALNDAFGDASVSRLQGADRYATAVEVARYGVMNCGLTWDGLAIATGQQFPDALAAGPMQAQAGSVLVCTPSTYLHDSVRLLLIGQRAVIDDVCFVGGTSAVNENVRTAVANALR